MRASRTLPIFAAALCGLGVLGGSLAVGQVNVAFNVPGPATWNSDGNWDPANVPDAQFNEIALIGGNRNVFVDDSPPPVGGIVMDTSTLEIRSGGALSVVPGDATNGAITLGQSFDTFLTVRRGGSLTAQQLNTGGGAGTILTLGETGGTGTATLSIAGGNLNRTTRIVGPNVNFSSSSDLSFGAQHVLAPVITGANHSTINVAGVATLGGVVRPELSNYTPALGNSWNLVTAGQLLGDLTLDASQLPATPRGVGYYLTETATTAKLNYNNLLLLSINRANGVATIENAIGSPISFDAYTIASPSGALGGTWNSLQQQGIPAWDEADNSSATRRTEFKTSGVTTLNAGGSHTLGALFAPTPPAAFGDPVGTDLTFQYSVPGSGTVTGLVEYVGGENNLVLTIDPTTGGAAIQNESPYFDVAIHAYSITSASGKLLPANASWNSLQDQGTPGWDEADNSNANRITEFKTSGFTQLPGGGTVLNLGTPINTAAGPLSLSDFGLQFLLSNGEVLQGVVKFGPLPTFNPGAGDYDSDGDVDGADFLAWQRSFGATVSPGSGADGNANGTVDAGDLTVWKANFGSAPPAAASVTAVPEPATLALAYMIAGAAIVAGGRSGGRISVM